MMFTILYILIKMKEKNDNYNGYYDDNYDDDHNDDNDASHTGLTSNEI